MAACLDVWSTSDGYQVYATKQNKRYLSIHCWQGSDSIAYYFSHAALPQLDRGSDYESERHRFESCTPHQFNLFRPCGAFFLGQMLYLSTQVNPASLLAYLFTPLVLPSSFILWTFNLSAPRLVSCKLIRVAELCGRVMSVNPPCLSLIFWDDANSGGCFFRGYMQYRKPWLSYDQQADKLAELGLIFNRTDLITKWILVHIQTDIYRRLRIFYPGNTV